MALRISNAAAIAAANAVVDLIDGGTGAGEIHIYTGSAPTNVEDAPTGTLLAELVMSDPAFGNAADINPGARATASAVADDSDANATGNAGYFRVVDSDDTAIMQGTVTATGGGGDMEINSVAIQQNATVSVTSFTYTQPET